MKRLPVVFLINATAAAFIAAGCSSFGRITPNAALSRTHVEANADAHAVIPLIKNTGDKEGFHIAVTVGSSTAAPAEVLFDTGSTGLWIYSDRVNSKQYTKIGGPVRYSYASGIEYRGTVVQSTVSFAGSGLTTGQVKFAVVTSAACKKNSNCSKLCANYGTQIVKCLETERKLSGTFGASIEPNVLTTITPTPGPGGTPAPPGKKYTLFNLILGIPRSWASSFIVKPDRVLVGPMATPGFTLVQLTPEPKSIPTPNSQAGNYRKPAPMCFTITGKGLNIQNYCIGSVFDTGEGGVTFYGLPQQLSTVATTCGNLIPSGVTVRMFMANATIGLVTTGDRQNWNEFSVKPSPTPDSNGAHDPYSNTGVTFFNRNEILFDAANGAIGFRPYSNPAHNFVTTCKPRTE